MPRYLTGTCKVCLGIAKFDIGDLEVHAAVALLKQREFGECKASVLPHVELGKAFGYYAFETDAAGQLVVTEAADERPTDEDYVKDLQAKGVVVTSNPGTYPGLQSFADFPAGELRHLGFGEFENDRYQFVRYDSPRGRRFYVVVERAS